MGIIKPHLPVKFIAAITYSPQAPLEEIFHRLETLFSEIDLRSEVYPFDFSEYYTDEMGTNLTKQMVAFRRLLPAESLPDFKMATNTIEADYSLNHNRRVNIDPGYICAAKLVLATTKDYDHRVYLGRGIFGDVHLRYRKKQFRVNEWTYPDYRQDHILEFFETVRETYLKQLAEW